MTPAIFLPGSTIGFLGSGQLGRLATLAAQRMGYRVHVYSPERDSPAGQVAHREFVGDYLDRDALRDFARTCDLVTLEFENLPAESLTYLAELLPVRPRGEILHTTQHRIREKQMLAAAGFPVAPFRIVHSLEELAAARQALGRLVLKSAAWGYDGKGQTRVDEANDLSAAWESIGRVDAVAEQCVEFQCEISVVIARGPTGQVKAYDPFENEHRDHILDVSICPATVGAPTRKIALEVAHELVSYLDYVGVLCVEFFAMADGSVVVNELAPRTHNSGHLTLDAHATSQFDQHIRAVCGLELGDAARFTPAAMANLLGDLWDEGMPRWDAALTDPCVKLCLYGKAEPRRRRKMGHLTAWAETVEQARDRVLAARNRLAQHG